MTVQELIDKLREYSSDKEVRFFYYDDISCDNQEAFFDSIKDEGENIEFYIS